MLEISEIGSFEYSLMGCVACLLEVMSAFFIHSDFPQVLGCYCWLYIFKVKNSQVEEKAYCMFVSEGANVE